jgi:adenosylcobyric acid synthase
MLRQVGGEALGSRVDGYEMHMGETTGPDTARSFARLDGGANDGAMNAEGNVIGSYLHGLFASPDLRRSLLARLGLAGNGRDYRTDVDAALDEIAAGIAAHADIDGLLELAGNGA